jgi:Respiratory-chain NADH dehydrogenase, 30 Kd subunit
MNAAEVRETISGTWTERAYGWTLCLPATAIRDTALQMLRCEARFSAIVAIPAAGGGLRLSWNWDLKGVLFSIESMVGCDSLVPSIADICPAADWAERETRDYYAVSFDHRVTTPPLMLRTGDQPGVLLRTEGGRL